MTKIICQVEQKKLIFVPVMNEMLKDILKRNQRWLARKLSIPDYRLSDKLNGYAEFTAQELTIIYEALEEVAKGAESLRKLIKKNVG